MEAKIRLACCLVGIPGKQAAAPSAAGPLGQRTSHLEDIMGMVHAIKLLSPPHRERKVMILTPLGRPESGT